MSAGLDALRAEIGPIRDLLGLEGRGPWRCPLHEDRRPSFSVYRGRNGRERWKCHAGCGGGDAIDLEAALAGVTTAEYLRRWRLARGSGERPAPPRREHHPPPPPPRPDPEVRERVRTLWRLGLAHSRSPKAGGDPGLEYLADRLGSADLAQEAIEHDLAAVLPPGASWRGKRLAPYRLAVPLTEAAPLAVEPDEADMLPCDLALRRIGEPSDHAPKIVSLSGAAPGVARFFGSVPGALAECDGEELIVVEGAVNWVARRLANGASVVGLHGAGTARRLAEVLEAEVRHVRSHGVGGLVRLVIDTDRGDRNQTGDKAAQVLANLAERLEVEAVRVDRRREEAA